MIVKYFSKSPKTLSSLPGRACLASAATLAVLAVPQLAAADIVTGTVTPASAKVTIVNAGGEKVADVKGGAYQLQLPPGKYKAQCQAPKQKQQDLLVLSEPVTVNISCE
jgi:hypothetical protein